MNETELIFPLHIDERSIKREAVKRRKQHQEQKILPESLPRYESEGWKKIETLKRAVKIIREKPFDERLENRCWMLLFRLGYSQLNKGRSFKIRIDRKGAEPLFKQVDVFGKDDETVIVAECKASERISKRSLLKDVEEFGGLKGPIASAINRHYKNGPKLKVIWMFVTENVIWSKNDRERAVGLNIKVVTEKELRYFSQIAEHIGRAARYQFLAELLKDQEIPGLSNRKVPAIRGRLGGKIFYCFATTPRHLLKIAFVNHRYLSDPEGAPAYQRLISRSRLKDISKYITSGGFFPNNLLVNFTRELRFEKTANCEDGNVQFGMLLLPSKYRSAWVIDGQHRLYGFSSIDDKFLEQNVIVVGFEKLPKVEEANLFVTINHEQKSVSKHLLDDLEGELKWESKVPSERIGAIASRLINYLNSDIDEPFHNRVTQQGTTTTNKTCLTIPGIKDTLLQVGLLGKPALKDTQYELGPLTGKTDFETLDRARDALNQFFKIISSANQAHWEKGREGYLSNNVGVQAYIRLFASLLKYWEGQTGSDAKQADPADWATDLEDYLRPVTSFLASASDQDMEAKFTVVLGSSGPIEYFFKLSQLIRSERGDFMPDGLATYEAEQSDERYSSATTKLRQIEEEINRTIFDIFRLKYGTDRDLYWDLGVPENSIKIEAYKRQLDDTESDRGRKESYLNLIDYKRIVEHRQNWPIFKELFNIPERGEKGHAKNLKWLDNLNELRRIPSHPSPDRRFKLDDYDYIDWIEEEFMSRVRKCGEIGLAEYLQNVAPKTHQDGLAP